MMEPAVTFARHGNGVGIWVGGKLVAVVKRDQLPAFIMLAATILRYPD